MLKYLHEEGVLKNHSVGRTMVFSLNRNYPTFISLMLKYKLEKLKPIIDKLDKLTEAIYLELDDNSEIILNIICNSSNITKIDRLLKKDNIVAIYNKHCTGIRI